MAGCRVSGDHPGCIFTYTSRRILVFVALADKRERERDKKQEERHCHDFFHLATSPCSWFCGSVTINRVVSFTSHFLNTDFKMWMVLPGWQIKNLLETNNICGSWYTCTTRLSSHRRTGVENYFFQYCFFFLIFYSIILIFNFLKIFPAELKANVDARAHQGAEVETCGVLIAKLLHAPNPLYLFRQS